MLLVYLLTVWLQPIEGDGQHERFFQSLSELVEVLTQQSLVEPETGMATQAINGMLQTLDPHSSYYDRMAFEEVMASQLGSFSGIGIRILKERSHLYISEVKVPSPAHAAGLIWGDQITHVNGIKVTTQNIDHLIDQIRGPLGNPIHLSIRSLNGETRDLELKRAEIRNTNLTSAFFFPSTVYQAKTGYVKLNEFGESSGQEVQYELEHMLLDGLEYLILDLRRNPGGLLPQANKVAGLFLPPRSLIVQTQGRRARDSNQYHSSSEPPLYRGPLTVLIDQNTASAAEIVAGALQDHDRAIVLGSQSWGKGLVQSVFSIPPGETGLALTTARYFTPLGRDIQGAFEDFYAYLQPDSGERFFFKDKSIKDSFVTTASGRKLFYTRGICPDVFLYDRSMVVAHQLTSLNHTLPLFLIQYPHKEPMDFRTFFSMYSDFFQYHNDRQLPIRTDQKEAVYLYREYVYYLTQHILNRPLDGEQILDDPAIQLALNLWEEAHAMSRTCFEHRPLSAQTLQTFLKMSQTFRALPSLSNHISDPTHQ